MDHPHGRALRDEVPSKGVGARHRWRGAGVGPAGAIGAAVVAGCGGCLAGDRLPAGRSGLDGGVERVSTCGVQSVFRVSKMCRKWFGTIHGRGREIKCMATNITSQKERRRQKRKKGRGAWPSRRQRIACGCPLADGRARTTSQESELRRGLVTPRCLDPE